MSIRTIFIALVILFTQGSAIAKGIESETTTLTDKQIRALQSLNEPQNSQQAKQYLQRAGVYWDKMGQ